MIWRVVNNNYTIQIQEFITELPTSPASGNFHMKHKTVLFKRFRYESQDFQSKIMINARSATATINLLKK
jgi:hypothetical protein